MLLAGSSTPVREWRCHGPTRAFPNGAGLSRRDAALDAQYGSITFNRSGNMPWAAHPFPGSGADRPVAGHDLVPGTFQLPWESPYFSGFAAVMILDILVALAVLAVLWLMKGDEAIFLVTRQMDAPMEPIRWLGDQGGRIVEDASPGSSPESPASGRRRPDHSGGIAPSGATLLERACRSCRRCVLLAAVNAFTEEAYFRCSLLSTLHDRDRPGPHRCGSILVFFGMSHWLYGSPSGSSSAIAMTGFLSWITAPARHARY